MQVWFRSTMIGTDYTSSSSLEPGQGSEMANFGGNEVLFYHGASLLGRNVRIAS